MLFRRTETHDGFNTSAIVPGAVKRDEFALCRKMRDVALIVPLAAFGFRGLGQGNVARIAGIHVLAQGKDRSALAGGIAPFEDGYHAAAGFLQPALHLSIYTPQILALATTLVFCC